MNILELCLSPSLGGLELYVLRSAQAMQHDNNIHACISPSGKLLERLQPLDNIKQLQLEHGYAYLPLINARRLARYIDANDIDIIHVHWGNDLPLAAFSKYLSARKPAIVYTRQMQLTRHKNDPYHRFLYRQTDLMLTITHRLEDDARRFIGDTITRIETLYYGVRAPDRFLDQDEIIALRTQHGIEPGCFVAGLVGRIEDGKGQHLLIKAIAKARQAGQNMHALIVGAEMEPGYRESLARLAQKLDVESHVTFLAFDPNPQLLMQVCDCMVLATYEETFGLVLPEAMRCGVAVVGSNRGGVLEIIDHGSTGLLFESMDADSLYQQLSGLYDSTELKHKLAVAGKQKADKVFNHEVHYAKLAQLFQALTASSKDS